MHISINSQPFLVGIVSIHGTSDDRDDGHHVPQRTDDGPNAAQMALSISLASTLPTFVTTSPTKKCRTSDHEDRLTSSRNAGTWVFAEAAHNPDMLQGRDAAEGTDNSPDDMTGDYEPIFQPYNSSGMMLVLSLTRFNYHPHQQFNRHRLQNNIYSSNCNDTNRFQHWIEEWHQLWHWCLPILTSNEIRHHPVTCSYQK